MKIKLPILSFLAALSASANADGIYAKNSPVLQVSGKDFSSLIEQSNHTSIVEFYAPWCGHCKNLKPAYEKAAKSLAGLAKVAAVNCDEESNKPFCGQMGVQGFPTLKIVKPGSKRGNPIIEDYQGARTAKAIVDAVIDKIPNHIKKIQDAGLTAWLEGDKQAKAILFTEKGTTAPLIKALAVDFLGSISFATIRNKEKDAVREYGVKSFPTIVLIPSGGKDAITYEGEMNKESLTKFFSQVAPPNPDPAPKKTKASSVKKSKDSPAGTASAKFSRASAAQKSSEFDEHMQAMTIELNDDTPTESPLPIVEQDQKPMVVKEAAVPIPQLATATDLESFCLTSKSGNCVLILLPTQADGETVQPLAAEALSSFAEVAEKHHKRGVNVFPFYGIPSDNEAGKVIRAELGLKSSTELEVIAINMKRKWWRPYPAEAFDIVDAENFVDTIRLGEGAKKKLPADFYSKSKMGAEDPPAPQVEAEPLADDFASFESATTVSEPASRAEPIMHNEL